MRPVNKWKVGYVFGAEIIKDKYSPHKSAKPHLESNLGCFCSYCEIPIMDEAMHVEHVKPQDSNRTLKYKWINFLVSCHRCNGADNKSNKPVIFKDIYLPHRNNTFKCIEYHFSGKVDVKPGLTVIESLKTKRLIELVGLQLMKGDPKHKMGDKRAERRQTVYTLALKYESDYSQGKISSIKFIVEFALGKGFWSVWMKVFESHPLVIKELILAFDGTFSDCISTNLDRK